MSKSKQWSPKDTLNEGQAEPSKPVSAETPAESPWLAQVGRFHRAFGVVEPDIPGFPDLDEVIKLRLALIREEHQELLEAIQNRNIVEVADAIGDLLVVAIGLARVFGMAGKLDAIMAEIDRSNMSKLGDDGLPVLREDGKITKGPNYSPPDIASILKA